MLKGVVKDAFKLARRTCCSALPPGSAATATRRRLRRSNGLGSAIAKLAGMLDKQPKAHSLKAVDVATECDCTPAQAIAVLKYLGFEEREGTWLVPKGTA
jgi:hypothetical protein